MKSKKHSFADDGFYRIRSLLGYQWARWFVLLGGRMTGKTYQVDKIGIEWKIREILSIDEKTSKPTAEPIKFYIIFKNDASMQNALRDSAKKLFDNDLVQKFIIGSGYGLSRLGDTVYIGKWKWDTSKKTGARKKIWLNRYELCRCVALSNMAQDKELVEFDNTFTGTYVFDVREMNREKQERKTFDITYNFINAIHTIVRDTDAKRAREAKAKGIKYVQMKIKCFLCGNLLEEASDLMMLFNFFPLEYGRYKIKKRHAVIDYIPPSEAYETRMEGSMLDDFKGTFEASTFTNEIKQDISQIYRDRLLKPKYVVQFSRDDKYTVWDGGVIALHNKENLNIVAMRPYQDIYFDKDQRDTIVDLYHSKSFMFKNIYTLRKFKKDLELLRRQG